MSDQPGTDKLRSATRAKIQSPLSVASVLSVVPYIWFRVWKCVRLGNKAADSNMTPKPHCSLTVAALSAIINGRQPRSKVTFRKCVEQLMHGS